MQLICTNMLTSKKKRICAVPLIMYILDLWYFDEVDDRMTLYTSDDTEVESGEGESDNVSYFITSEVQYTSSKANRYLSRSIQ